MPRKKGTLVLTENFSDKISELKKDPNYYKVGPATTRSIFFRLRRATFANCTREKGFDPVEVNRKLQSKLYDYIVNQKKIPSNAIVEAHISPTQEKILLITYLPSESAEIS